MSTMQKNPQARREQAFALAAGLLFGLGLAISGMSDADKVQNFLDLFGNWDPSLAVVMAAALAVALPGYRLALRRARPVCATAFQLPDKRSIDAPLLIGAALFGIGWGLAGYCPGPAVANLARLSGEALVFLPAMLAGSWLYGRWQQRNP